MTISKTMPTRSSSNDLQQNHAGKELPRMTKETINVI